MLIKKTVNGLGYIKNSLSYGVLFTVLLIAASIFVPLYFRQDALRLGEMLFHKYGQERFDIFLYLMTSISSTPIALPVWVYAIFGTMLGYEKVRLVIIMATGAATGGTLTYMLGRYFGRTQFVKRHFPNIENHKWTEGRSMHVVSLILFLGTASPIPFDFMFAACGVKQFPLPVFWLVIISAWIVKLNYLLFGYGLIQQ